MVKEWKNTYILFLAILIVIILIGSFIIITFNNEENTSKKVQDVDITIVQLANISYYHNIINDFAFKIFKNLYDGNDENVFISPYSIFNSPTNKFNYYVLIWGESWSLVSEV